MGKKFNYFLILTVLALVACKNPSVDPTVVAAEEGRLGTPTPTPLPTPTPTLDVTPPNVVFNHKPSGFSNRRDYTITFTASDPESGVDVVDCTLNGQVYAPCTSPVKLTGLEDGDYELEVSATDKKNNKSKGEKAKWSVDLAGPTMTIHTKPPESTRDTVADFSFDASNDKSGIEALYCSLNGATFQVCQSPVNFSQLGVRTHTFQVYGRDKSGNDGVPASYNWTVNP